MPRQEFFQTEKNNEFGHYTITLIHGVELRVAILEDDPDQAELIGLWLTHADHTVESFADGNSFLRAVRRDSFDLYMLDWMLPDLSGIDVLEKLRRELSDHTPVVIVTAKDEERSVVRGLESGADDYLIKPLRQAELTARVAAVLRRTGGNKVGGQQLNMAPYVFDLGAKNIQLHDQVINLTNREFDLALFFFRNSGKMISRNHLLETIWGIENKSVSTRTVDTHVSRLRKKLNLCAENVWVLSAIYQHGYRMEKVAEKVPASSV